jgi:putative pyruvate formate lyase activating enzyme
MKEAYPSYLSLSDTDFNERIAQGAMMLKKCRLCGNYCEVDRKRGDLGLCRTDDSIRVSSFSPHFGEEPPVSGSRGSGTVFLTGCSLSCLFCQNYPISHYNNGNIYKTGEFAKKIIGLQEQGVHNINLVSPTHQVPKLIEGIYGAVKMGLNIPIVYNSGGYDSLECLRLLDGLVDIYMPDFKYSDNEAGLKYSGVRNYREISLKAVSEMNRQVGVLELDKNETANRGLIIRHLIIPGQVEQSIEAFELLSRSVPKKTYISLLGQVFPAYKSDEAGLTRKLSGREYQKVIDAAQSMGFVNVYVQDLFLEAGDIARPPKDR